MRNNRLIVGLLLLLPLMILIGIFYLYPIISMSRLSLYSTQFGFGDLEFNGLNNFVSLSENPAFYDAIRNSIIWTILSLVIQLSIPVGLAILLNQKLKGISVARSLILIPWIIPGVVVAILWRWLLEPTMGILNQQLVSLGIIDQAINFLGSRSLALLSLIFINSLKYIPFGTLLILASLQNIPKSLYEQMDVDGANAWQKLRFLIMPMIGPMIGFMGFLVLIWNFNVFDLIQMTTEGGPANATLTIPVLIYRTAYRTFNMGHSAALSVIVIIIMILAGTLYFKYVWSGSEEV